MLEKPIRRDDTIVSPYMWSAMIWCGLFVACSSIFFLTSSTVRSLFVRDGVPSTDVFMTAFFGFFIFISVMNAFNVRTHHVNIFENILNNRGFLLVLALIFLVQVVFTYIGGSVLRTVPLLLHEWIGIFTASLVIIPWDILRKIFIVPFLPKRFVDTTKTEDDSEKKDNSSSNSSNSPVKAPKKKKE